MLEDSSDLDLNSAPELLPAEDSARTIILNQKFIIYIDEPLSDLSSKYSFAYAARGEGFSASEIYALRCDPNLPQRMDMLEIALSLSTQSLVTPVEWGSVYWPQQERCYFTIILKRPAGHPLTHIDRSIWKTMSYSQMCTSFLEPLSELLIEMEKNGMTHRSIRPQNIFFAPETQTVILGECYSTPPAMEQPPFFEPLPSLNCHPMARGEGSITDDLYSLGAVLGFLFTSQELNSLLSDRDLYQLKTEETSYHTILQKGQPPKHLETVLAGLLQDDTDERWTAFELLTHITGEIGKHARPKLPERPPRPFIIEGKKHYFTNTVAAHLAKLYKDCEKIIRSSDFSSWIRTCPVKGVVQEIEYILSVSRVNNEPWNRTLGKILCRLSPEGPIFYKDFAFLPDGLGYALIALRHDPEKQQLILEAIASNLSTFWQQHQESMPDATEFTINRIRNAATFLPKKGPGFGIERTLYEVSETLHCLSPLVEKYYLATPTDLLMKLNALAKENVEREIQLVDRHILAYLIARQPNIPSRVIRNLEQTSTDVENALALLIIFQTTQTTFKIPPLPDLCERLIRTMPALLERIKLKKRRDLISVALQKKLSEGNFETILGILDNHVELALDEQQFNDSKMNYKRLSLSIIGYEKLLSKSDELGQLLGEQVSAIACGFLAAISLSLFYLL